MPQHVEVHLVGKVVAADPVEKGRPGRVGQLDLVDGVRREQPAVITGNAVRFVAGVDEAKEILEVLPTGIGHGVKAGHAVRLGDRLLGQQPAILAKGDENDAIEQPLRHLDRLVQRPLLFEMKLGDQLRAVAGVILVEPVADLPLALGRFLQQGHRPRRPQKRRVDQALAVKEHVELLEQFEIAQRLQRKVLVRALRRSPLVEPEADDVGDDAPAALGRGVHQVIPALGHGRSAVAAVAVEMNGRPLQLDHRQRLVLLRLPKEAQDRIRRFVGDVIMLLAVPDLFSVERSGVAQRVAEHLGQKIALHLRFVALRQPAGALQIGPLDEHGVGGLQRVLVEAFVFGCVLEKTRQDQAVGLGLTLRDGRIDAEEGLLPHFLQVVRALVVIA